MENKRLQVFDDIFDLFSMLVGNNYVTLYDIKQRVTRYSSAIVDMVGLPGEYIDDGMYNWADYIHPDDRAKYETVMGEMFTLRQHTYDLTYRVRLKDGKYSLFRFVGGVIRDRDGHPSIAGGMMINAGMLNNIDRVTAMRDLAGFFEDMLYGEHPGGYRIMMIGFGRLAHINEVYGYGYGSHLLRAVGDTIRAHVGVKGFTYRMEGSKFAVVSDGLSVDEMSGLYENIRIRLRKGIEADGVKHNLAAYAGLVESRGGKTDDARTLYDCLLHACAESKRYRDGELVIYDGDRRSEPEVSDKLALIGAVRESLHSDYEGFYLLYQPIFHADTLKPSGAEASLLWHDETLGDVRSESFMPEISHDYAFEKLGYWFLRKALTDGREFLSSDPEFKIAVTLPPVLMSDRYFLDNIGEIAREVGFPVTNISVLLMRECRLLPQEKLELFAGYLKEKQVRFGIDDFARGNAWLKTFTNIEPDFVRFSSELIERIDESERDLSILSHLVEMVRACGGSAYIKGVDSPAVRQLISKMPIDGVQGSAYMDFVYYDEVLELYATEDSDN